MVGWDGLQYCLWPCPLGRPTLDGETEAWVPNQACPSFSQRECSCHFLGTSVQRNVCCFWVLNPFLHLLTFQVAQPQMKGKVSGTQLLWHPAFMVPSVLGTQLLWHLVFMTPASFVFLVAVLVESAVLMLWPCSWAGPGIFRFCPVGLSSPFHGEQEGQAE